MSMSSRTRLSEYVSLFMIVDEMRVEVLKTIVTNTHDKIQQIDLSKAEVQENMPINKLDFLNGIADNIINAIMENGELNGSN